MSQAIALSQMAEQSNNNRMMQQHVMSEMEAQRTHETSLARMRTEAQMERNKATTETFLKGIGNAAGVLQRVGQLISG